MRNLKNKNILIAIVLIFALVGFMLLAQENLGRATVILSLFVLWGLIAVKSKDLVLASILTLLLAFPFNITFQLGFLSAYFDPYIDGVLVNYLIPTVSIIDLFSFLLVVVFALEVDSTIIKKFRFPIALILAYFVGHNIIFHNLTTLIISFRYFILICTTVVVTSYLSNILAQKENREKLISFAKYLLFIIGFGLIIQLVIGLLQIYNGHSVGLDLLGESTIYGSFHGVSFVSFDGGSVLRAYGTFPHPNLLGGYLIAVQFVTLFIASILKTRLKFVSLTLSIIASLTVFMTFSRTAVMLMIFVWLMFVGYWAFISFREKRRISKSNKGRIKLQLVAPVYFVAPWIQRILDIFNGASVSAVERVELFTIAISVLSSSVFLGCGIGNFIRSMGDLAPVNSSGITIFEPVHNVFMLFAVENGLPLFIICFIIWGILIVKGLKRQNNLGKLVIACSTLLVIIAGMFDHYLLSFPQGNMLLVGYAVILLICINISSRKNL